MKRLLVLFAGALVVAVLGAATVVLLRDGDTSKAGGASAAGDRAVRDGKVVVGPKQAPFAVRMPRGWSQLASKDVGAGGALFGMRRSGADGLVTVSVRAPVRGGVAALRRDLPGELEKKFADFELLSSKPLEVNGRKALYLSFLRTKTGKVQSTLVVPRAQGRSWTVDSIVAGDADQAAREVGLVMRSFDIVS